MGLGLLRSLFISRVCCPDVVSKSMLHNMHFIKNLVKKNIFDTQNLRKWFCP
jgi:hypothetical protein